MNIKLGAIGLALLTATALVMPATSHAGTIGYFNSNCLVAPGSKITAIQNAGHTAVAVASISAATLAPLDGLIVDSCLGYVANADINAAVDDGMLLVINDSLPNATTAGKLPGTPAIAFTLTVGGNVNLASGTPIATGPGGTLTNTSLDGIATYDGYTATSLPAYVTALLTTNNSGRKVALAYKQGNGFVAYNAIPMGSFLPGGFWDSLNLCTPTNACAGMQTYLTNLLDWSIKQLVTCESEGYRGAQLTWCKNICENGLTGQVLDTWIHRWINRYRDLPYCAAVVEAQQPD